MLGEISLEKQHRKMVGDKPAYPCSENYLFDLDLVIVGGETGAGARPLQYEWVKNIQAQCETANVPFFFKKWGKLGLIDGYIDGVECRAMPECRTVVNPF